MPADNPLPIFISYSHQDEAFFKRLLTYLKPLQRAGDVDAWNDTRIKPGQRWKEEIKKALEAAKVAVLLISPDFLASDFINDEELPKLLTAANDSGVLFLSVVVGVVNLNRYPEIKAFQAVNDIAKPLVKMQQPEQDEVWQRLVDAIEDALKNPR